MIQATVTQALLRTHGRIVWEPGWAARRDVEPVVVTTPDGLAIRIQLLNAAGYERWPTKIREIEQRYRDAPPATLRVPTIQSFAAWKTATWIDRHAARDLYDLWALSRVGALNAESVGLFVRYGPTGMPPQSWMFDRAPSAGEWRSQLAAQTRLEVTPNEAIDRVRAAWAAAVAEFE